MDITENVKRQEIKEMFSKYSYTSINIGNLPFIIVFENGMIKEIYNISDNNYDILGLTSFINNIRFPEGEELNG